MADKNKNGIEDSREGFRGAVPGYISGGATKSPPKPKVQSGDDKTIDTFRQTSPGGSFGVTSDNNWLTDRMRDWTNFVGELANPTRRNTIGGGYGDYLLGSNPNDQAAGLLGTYRGGSSAGSRSRAGGGSFGEPVSDPGMAAPAPEKTLADYLKMATEMIGAGGAAGGGIPLVNYDPQRNTARSQASENDARLEAMYRQLRGSIEADAPGIQQGYQQAIDSTAQNSATAQQQTQAASDSANARNNEVLANLGIQQAQGNIIQNGTDLNTQTAGQIGAQAAKGQAAGDRLVSNQATALTHNTNIGNAAGLEGNLQRASNNARLQALLADIDMQEQNQNQSISAQNAARTQNGLGDQLQLAQWLMGNATDERRYQDDLSMQAADMAAKASQTQQLPQLQQFLDALGIAPEDIAKNPQNYGSLLTSLTKYQ